MRVRRAGCRARLLPLDQRPDVLDQHGDGDRVEAALGDDDVGVFLGRFDELLVHGLHGGGVLGDYGLHGASPLADIAQDTPCQADIRVGIHKNFNVHQLPQLLVLEDEDAVHNDHFRRTHGHSLGHAVMLHERIDRMLDGYVALERPNMPDKHVGIESLGMVVVELGALLVGQLRMGLVVVVVAKRDHLALKSFLKTFDQRALAGTGAAGNPDDRYVHKFDSLSLCPVCLTSPSGTAGSEKRCLFVFCLPFPSAGALSPDRSGNAVTSLFLCALRAAKQCGPNTNAPPKGKPAADVAVLS